MRSVAGALGVAVALWAFAFRWRPLGFWGSMTVAAGALGATGLAGMVRSGAVVRPGAGARPSAEDLGWGVASAVALAAAFHAGAALIRAVAPGAGARIAEVYAMDPSVPRGAVAAALLLVIGPAEELFWRVFLQDRMARAWGHGPGWAGATVAYGAVHLVTGNPLLVTAALAAGAAWGLMWWRRPRPWRLVVSHAVWDVIMFALWPV